MAVFSFMDVPSDQIMCVMHRRSDLLNAAHNTGAYDIRGYRNFLNSWALNSPGELLSFTSLDEWLASIGCPIEGGGGGTPSVTPTTTPMTTYLLYGVGAVIVAKMLKVI